MVTLNDSSPVTRLDLLTYLDQRKIGTRLLFAGNLVSQPYMQGVNFRVSADLNNTEKVMNHSFWIGLHPSLTPTMLDHTIASIENYLGLGFKD